MKAGEPKSSRNPLRGRDLSANVASSPDVCRDTKCRSHNSPAFTSELNLEQNYKMLLQSTLCVRRTSSCIPCHSLHTVAAVPLVGRRAVCTRGQLRGTGAQWRAAVSQRALGLGNGRGASVANRAGGRGRGPLRTVSLVNVDLGPSTVVGLVLIGAGAALYQVFICSGGVNMCVGMYAW